MKYDPELAIKFGFTGDDEKIYRICCAWVLLSRSIFPDYRHSRVPNLQNLKKSILYRIIRKCMLERNFERIEEYVYFIRAQLMIFKNYQVQTGQPILIEPIILTGEPSERRWFFWKKLVAQANAITKQVYTIQDSDMEFDLQLSLNEIIKICDGNLSFDNFKKATDKIKTAIILRKIKPIYVYLSNWIGQLPDKVVKDFQVRSGCASFEKCDTVFAKKVYCELFKFEINKS